jgi:cation diffusion facilitator CzcD-associated flavoprotein CzcO
MAKVIIVGAGFGGMAAAVALRDHDVALLEAAPELGGTWFQNTYPGAACDVPSHLYSFSFAQRKDWTRLCSPQEEILDYMRGVARDQGIAERVVGNARVTACAYDETRHVWTVTCEDGSKREADAVVIATGQLHQPAYPRLAGRDAFAGHQFHSAEWDHGYDLTGKSVAVVGTGASAVQFAPEIAPQVGRLHVFQRSGNWFLPRRNRPYPAWFRWLVRTIPGLQAFRRRFIFNYGESLTAMIRHPRTLGLIGRARSAALMRWQLRDPEVRRKAWPDYTFGCKRVLFSSYWLPMLQRPNVELITEAVTGLTADGVMTEDGTHRRVDCIIWATGFRTNDFMLPMEVRGAGGVTLADYWGGAPRAHLGITVPGFPSLFLMYGPNTNTSGGSIIAYEEAQAAYVRQAIELGIVEVLPEVAEASDRETQARFAGTAWTQCDSWYRKDHDGRIVANWPGYMREYLQRTAVLDPSQYRVVKPDNARAVVPGPD